MPRANQKIREEARRLFLTGEATTNAEIAARLDLKPHTVGVWRKLEDWDGLRIKIDRRAAEMLVEKIATDNVTLNVKHFRLWELILAKMAESLKATTNVDVKTLEHLSLIVDKAQRGQRVSKGMSANGETEEAIRAQAHSEMRSLVDVFIDSVKENVEDEKTREKIRRAILEKLPEEPDDGAGNGGDQSVH